MAVRSNALGHDPAPSCCTCSLVCLCRVRTFTRGADREPGDCCRQFRASYYAAYAERLASWQYAVVQYNTPLFDVIDDADEVTVG